MLYTVVNDPPPFRQFFSRHPSASSYSLRPSDHAGFFSFPPVASMLPSSLPDDHAFDVCPGKYPCTPPHIPWFPFPNWFETGVFLDVCLLFVHIYGCTSSQSVRNSCNSTPFFEVTSPTFLRCLTGRIPFSPFTLRLKILPPMYSHFCSSIFWSNFFLFGFWSSTRVTPSPWSVGRRPR